MVLKKPIFIMAVCLASSVCAQPLHLTLHEAITLGLRFNANVRNAELSRVEQKFSLAVAQWNFEPHYTLTGSRDWTMSRSTGNPRETSQSWSATPGVSWNSAIGTTVSAHEYNTWGGGSAYNPSVTLSITQPLIAGFGRAIVERTLLNAYDDTTINKLSLKSTIMQQVTATISAYTGLVGAENTVAVDKKSLQLAQKNLFQTVQYIKAGQNPRSDEIQAKAQVAQAKAQLQTDKSNLVIARYSLLQTIGLKSTTQVTVTHDIPYGKYVLPSQQDSIKQAVKNNISYQTSVIGLSKLARAVMSAKDANRWSLNLVETYTRGSASDPGADTLPFYEANNNNGALGGSPAGIIGNQAYGSTTELNLTVPIDNMGNQESILDTKIALEQAEISLKQSRQNLITQTISKRDDLLNTKMQIQLDETQASLDKQTLQNTIRRYHAGMASSLEVQQQSQQYVTDERSLVSTRISYFNALAAFDESNGHALKTWGIHVQY